MSQFINSINEVRKNYSKYDEWEQKQADERAQKEYLAANFDIPKDELELTKKRAETIIRATEIMDARSEDNCQNMEQLTSMVSVVPALGLPLLQGPLQKFLEKRVENKYKPELAKLERELFDTIDSHELERIRIKRDKLSLKQDKLLSNIRKRVPFAMIGVMLISTIGLILWGNSKQKEASRIGRFQAKQNELKDENNFVIYTPEQLEKAKEIAKNIPDEKDRNSISKMIKELKDVSKDKKAYKEWFENKDSNEIEKLKQVNLLPEQLKKAEEDKELIVDAVKEINIKAEEYSENVENSYDTLSMLSWLIAAPLGFGLNKLLRTCKMDKKYTPIVSSLVSVLTPVVISLIGTLEQKKAARVGRYKARQDLLKNPARLMAYSKDDMKKAENIKAPNQKESLFEKFGGSFKFLSTYTKDKKEYNKYKKSVKKENDKFQKALKQVETTDAQKTEAKALQKNVFRAFDEVDEMSQRYSEDVEAGTEIAKQVGGTAWTLSTMLGTGFLAMSIFKGKFPIVKLLNKLSNMTFNGNSTLKKAVNNLNDVLSKQGKAKTRGFQEALVTGDIMNFLHSYENKAIKEACMPLITEFEEIGINSSAIATSQTKKSMNEILSKLLQPHFKQTGLAKWTRSITAQCTKLWLKLKSSNMGIEIPKELEEQMGMKFNYKNYKTLINTGIALSAPALATIFAVPYAFNAWLTNIQKKAGKIGIMKAMDKIDDARVFASDMPVETKKQEIESQNLLDKFKQQGA